MPEHLSQADGQGHIDVNGHVSPVSYHLVAERSDNDGDLSVRIELSLPRDWLLEKGFDSQATLIRDNGEHVEVRSAEKIGPDAPISVVLRTNGASCKESEFAERYPEFPSS